MIIQDKLIEEVVILVDVNFKINFILSIFAVNGQKILHIPAKNVERLPYLVHFDQISLLKKLL